MNAGPLAGAEVTVPKHDCKGTISTYRATDQGTLLTVETVTGERLPDVHIDDVEFTQRPAAPKRDTAPPAERADFSDVSTHDLARGILLAVERNKRVGSRAAKALAERVLAKSGRAA